ncbi:MAG: ispDF [Devosia sp.]|nr:ispDF [Devosia sp.]
MSRNRIIAAIVVAAGRGERASGAGDPTPKQYRSIGGVPVLARTLRNMLAVPGMNHLAVVIAPEHAERLQRLAIDDPRVLPPVHGGPTRQESVRAGLAALAPLRPDYVLIQDAARPFSDAALSQRVIAALADHDGALPAMPVTDTLKRSLDGTSIVATEDRHTLFAAQTPQGFRFAQILSAHLRAANLPREFTDDAAIAEWAGLSVRLVPGAGSNFKITRPEDFARAERLLAGDNLMETRIGTGFDVHPFEPGTSVWLGGVEIPHTAKLKGHSDADVGLHALTDALLGAIGEGDIGTHFPPTDMQWRGMASAHFLRHAAALVKQRHGRIVNLDLTLVCEAPRIGPHVAAMCASIAEACGISASRVAVKATTSEKLGFTGREEGIVAMASASVELPREE